MPEETKQPNRKEYGPIHPTAKLIGAALAVFAVLYALFALLSKSPEEKARQEARDRQVLIDAERRGAELLQQRDDPRGWGPGVHYDAGQPHQTVRPPVAVTAPPQSSTPACDISAATNVRSNLGQMMVAQEFRNQMAYSISANWWGTIRPRLGELVRAAANADTCLSGKARRIDFYGPDGKRVAFADPNQGIRVLVN